MNLQNEKRGHPHPPPSKVKGVRLFRSKLSLKKSIQPPKLTRVKGHLWCPHHLERYKTVVYPLQTSILWQSHWHYTEPLAWTPCQITRLKRHPKVLMETLIFSFNFPLIRSFGPWNWNLRTALLPFSLVAPAKVTYFEIFCPRWRIDSRKLAGAAGIAHFATFVSPRTRVAAYSVPGRRMINSSGTPESPGPGQTASYIDSSVSAPGS